MSATGQHVWVGGPGGGDGREEARMKKTGKAAVTVGDHASAAAEALSRLAAAPGPPSPAGLERLREIFL
jgi:hypothetical protein